MEYKTERIEGLPDSEEVMERKRVLGNQGWIQIDPSFCMKDEGKYITFIEFRREADIYHNNED